MFQNGMSHRCCVGLWKIIKYGKYLGRHVFKIFMNYIIYVYYVSPGNRLTIDLLFMVYMWYAYFAYAVETSVTCQPSISNMTYRQKVKKSLHYKISYLLLWAKNKLPKKQNHFHSMTMHILSYILNVLEVHNNWTMLKMFERKQWIDDVDDEYSVEAHTTKLEVVVFCTMRYNIEK